MLASPWFLGYNTVTNYLSTVTYSDVEEIAEEEQIASRVDVGRDLRTGEVDATLLFAAFSLDRARRSFREGRLHHV